MWLGDTPARSHCGQPLLTPPRLPAEAVLPWLGKKGSPVHPLSLFCAYRRSAEMGLGGEGGQHAQTYKDTRAHIHGNTDSDHTDTYTCASD